LIRPEPGKSFLKSVSAKAIDKVVNPPRLAAGLGTNVTVTGATAGI
jgi:hypothetical protein